MTYYDLIKPLVNTCKEWEKKFAFFPKKSCIDGKIIFLRFAVRGSRTVRWDTHIFTEHYWMSEEQYTWHTLTYKDTSYV